MSAMVRVATSISCSVPHADDSTGVRGEHRSAPGVAISIDGAMMARLPEPYLTPDELLG